MFLLAMFTSIWINYGVEVEVIRCSQRFHQQPTQRFQRQRRRVHEQEREKRTRKAHSLEKATMSLHWSRLWTLYERPNGICDDVSFLLEGFFKGDSNRVESDSDSGTWPACVVSRPELVQLWLGFTKSTFQRELEKWLIPRSIFHGRTLQKLYLRCCFPSPDEALKADSVALGP